MTIVDSNVLLDVVDGRSAWFDWSAAQLDEASNSGLMINAIIYAEIAPAFANDPELEAFAGRARLVLAEFTRPILFRAGQAHAHYRHRGGERDRVLPDFLIGAHAAVAKLALLTRDPRRYRSYFPDVRLITP